MSELDGRVTELEIALAHQERTIGGLNHDLLEANKVISLLERRLTRAEDALKELLGAAQLPPNERPPHY